MITVRRADITEYDGVRAFYHEVIDEFELLPYHPRWEKDVYPAPEELKKLIGAGQLYLGLFDGTIVSAMVINHEYNESYEKFDWPVKAKKDEVYMIHMLAVLPSLGRRNIGKAMVSYALSKALEDKMKAVRLDVLKGNLPANRLYEGFGFKKLCTLPMFYPDTGWTDFELYELDLKGYEPDTEYLDVCDGDGNITGEKVERHIAHKYDIRHRTAHVWIVRKTEAGYDILMQKRADNKESFPGCFDTSSAGHIPAGQDPLTSAVRELKEELGISAKKEDFSFAGLFRNHYEMEFFSVPFKDNEVTFVYVYDKEPDIKDLKLQEEEVSSAQWFDLDYVLSEKAKHNRSFCVPTEGLEILKEFLEKKEGKRA